MSVISHLEPVSKIQPNPNKETWKAMVWLLMEKGWRARADPSHGPMAVRACLRWFSGLPRISVTQE